MVFVKFHNMTRKKNFLMSPLNSNKLTNFHFTTSQSNITITVHKCSVFFPFFFPNLCTVYFSKKCSFFSFFFFSICCVQQCSSFLSFPLCPFSIVLYLFFSFFFHNKLLIHCPFFFFNLISVSLCLYLNTITIGSLPSLFNFNP